LQVQGKTVYFLERSPWDPTGGGVKREWEKGSEIKIKRNSSKGVRTKLRVTWARHKLGSGKHRLDRDGGESMPRKYGKKKKRTIFYSSCGLKKVFMKGKRGVATPLVEEAVRRST